MRVWPFAAALVALGAVTAVTEAQDRSAFGLLMGPMPLAPDSLSAVVRLDQAQRGRYVTLYGNFKKRTQAEFDSLRAIMGRMRDARQRGDQAGADRNRESTRKLREASAARRKAFDEALKELLTKDQWGKYQQWRADAPKKAAAERARAMRDRGPPPPQP